MTRSDIGPDSPSRLSVLGSGYGSSRFEAQLHRFLHRRLRFCVVVLGAATLAIFTTSMVTHLLSGGFRESGVFDPLRLTLLGCVVAAGLEAVLLSKKKLSDRWLLVADAGLAWGVTLGCAVSYLVVWRHGTSFVLPILGLFLLGRGVFIPCRAARTFWLSIVAVPVILAVQLYQGRFYANASVQQPEESFWPLVAWNQLILILSVGLATVTSRVSFLLRRKVYDATTLGQYQLVTKIGEGSMGEVYKARHAMMLRPTAVKIIRAAMVDDQTIARFEREVQQTARLTHPNTIVVYDCGRTPEGTFYYAMELLEGQDLKKIVRATGPMPPARVIHIMAQASAALAEAHALGLVHRDVKPGNLILCERGLQHDIVKVMDFGLVKDTKSSVSDLTGVGEVCGTPETIAPETISGQACRPAADLYALGAVGYTLLTGEPIFDAESAIAFISMHLLVDPVPPSGRGVEVPADLERILLSCLAKDPADRPESGTALRNDLLACGVAGEWTEEDAAAWWREWREGRGAPESTS